MVSLYVYFNVQHFGAFSFCGFIVNEFSSAIFMPKIDGFEFFFKIGIFS